MPICDFMAGSLSGMFSICAGHPFDTLKVNQQVSGSGMIECGKSIYQQGGVRGFFRGVSFPFLAYGSVNSIFFGVYAHSLEWMLKQGKCSLEDGLSNSPLDLDGPGYIPDTPVQILEIEAEEKRIRRFHASYATVFAAGAFAGVAQLGLMCPIEVLKIQQQTQPTAPGSYKLGFFRYTVDLVKTNGFKSLYKGLVPSALREGPSCGVYMMVYHFGNKYTHSLNLNPDSWLHYVGLFTSGGVAGVLAWWFILPVDVIKTQIQADDLQNPRYKGILDCAQSIWREHGNGFRVFFRGFVPISLRAFPINGLTFLTYELFVQMCHLHIGI